MTTSGERASARGLRAALLGEAAGLYGPSTPRPARARAARELRDAGCFVTEIARALGASRATIHRDLLLPPGGGAMSQRRLDVLARANSRRVSDAAERNAKTASELLAVPLPPRMRAVVEARAANPGAAWPEVAETLGVSKDAAASLWRRALKRRPA